MASRIDVLLWSLRLRPGLLNSWWLRARSFSRSDFGNKALWFTFLSAFDRVMAVVQTVLISRALGITEYGVYGLLLGTIGFVASIVGLQMGLTATVYVSRYRESEKEKAAAVISIVGGFGWVVAVIFLAALGPFSEQLSVILLNSASYQVATLLGIIFVGATIVNGVQDGIAQGFEIFNFLAKLKITVSILVLASIYPMAHYFGLTGVLCAILAGLVLKFVVLQMVVRRCRIAAGVPAAGSGVSFQSLIGNFALPSMAVSLLVGFVTWGGMFLLSRQPVGFDGVAIANTGLQWRGPVLLLAASLGGVAVPAFSRFSSRGDVGSSKNLRRKLSLLNLGVASAVAIFLISASELIMSMYGAGFVAGRVAFSVIVLSTVPMVVANVYMQELVGSARMWRQFSLHVPFAIAMGLGFCLLVPRYGVNGYACTLLLGSVVLLGSVRAAEYISSYRCFADR